MRLTLAVVLRVVCTLALGLALLISLVTVVGIVMILATDEEAAGFGMKQILPMWAGCVALLLAISRLAYLALRQVAELDPPDKIGT